MSKTPPKTPISMKKYKPESSFKATDDSTIVYNLRTTGRFQKGQEEWENDVAISITSRHLTDEQRAEIAEMIRETMNAKYRHSDQVLAVDPFTPDAYGGMRDADGDRVITCNDECPPCTLYKENMVDADAHFICQKCGRLGQLMEEASHRQVLTANTEACQPEGGKKS
jgi:hypothetical protein